MAATQFDFLEHFILDLLAQNGLGELDEDQRALYVPKLLAQLEQRIGLEMMPKLPEDKLDEFALLLDNEQTTAEEWQTFWYGAIEHFEQELQGVLTRFAADVTKILNAA